MRKKFAAVFVSALVSGLALAGSAEAGVIYNNYGPGQSYQNNAGVIEGGINNPITHNQQSTLASFVAATSGLIDQIRTQIFHFPNTPITDTIVLYSNIVVNGQNRPDPHSNPLAPFVPATYAPLGSSSLQTNLGMTETFTFTTDVLLTSGQTYWIGLFTGSDSADNWLYNSTGQTSTFCTTFGPVPMALTNTGCTAPTDPHTTPVFSITSRVIPEPLTLSLFGAGLAGMLAARRRRKASFQKG